MSEIIKELLTYLVGFGGLIFGYIGARYQFKLELNRKLKDKVDKTEYDAKIESIEKEAKTNTDYLKDKIEEVGTNMEYIRNRLDVVIDKHIQP